MSRYPHQKLFLAAPLALAAGLLPVYGQQPAPRPPDSAFDITLAEVAGQRHYAHPLRPQLHYTPIQGHIGDATGLFYYGGEYHLFYMYDQWSRRRLAHKQWGHAVSRDLIHWEELPPVLDKLIDNSPGSGSGIVDWNDSLGLRQGSPDKTVAIFYTDYQRGTGIAYSRDRGRTWTRHPRNPVVPRVDDSRDPTVFWHPPTSDWRMLRYENKGFAIFKSKNLVDWTQTSHLPGFYECPDLMRLPVLNSPGEHRWVLIDGDGSYVLGDFDGDRFVAQTGKLLAEYAKTLYATQSWKRTIEGESPIIQVAWSRYPYEPKLAWHGQTSFPVQLTLWKFPDGIRLCRNPIDELDNLRVGQQRWRDMTVTAGRKPMPEIQDGLLDVKLEIETKGAATIGADVAGKQIRYSVAQGVLRVDSAEAPLKLTDGRLKVRLLVDRSSVDVFADRGQITVSTVSLKERSGPVLTLVSEGGSARVVNLEVNKLESIWAGQR